ncbi:Sir2 family NAD-dependent protein deacetylase, partial [Variovorax sp. LT1R20]|uniref:Sir2 family NAD-dependent protein deacetylase n=1 Tax=Variovorax sp. LT1R20 TaxID=3443729 RepID=UPI003F46D168
AARRRYKIGGTPISMGQLCEDGTQLRPDVVWFGEEVEFLAEAKRHIASAGRVLVIGTSLSVFPVAALVKAARGRAEKVLVAFDVTKPPYGYTFLRGKATELVPAVTNRWLAESRQSIGT